ncbi:MAG: aminotransferase class V-fold PLP-dependent enzyme [Ilumatobacter sp.]|uniref:aminotransferase class V-fold PLP-dependent enzyme n=1 Tax=Ilumatobacter sp. TaxID=1967498 RepID=UPI00391A0972
MSAIERSTAEELDAGDALAHWRDEFVVVDPDLIYLDGNSLGMAPKRSIAAVRDAMEHAWAGDLITSWWEHEWLDLPLAVGDRLAPVIGARPGEVAVHDSTTVCLFQLVNIAIELAVERRGVAAAESRPAVVAVSATEFPTDRYVVDGIARLRTAPGGSDRPVVVRRGLDDLDGADVVVRSLVDYRTASVAPLAEETARAAAHGAVTVWDLSHAAGVVALDLEGAGVEFAAGCTYKFLNGGPGSPAFTYVRSSLQADIRQPIWGWFGQTNQFAMDNDFDPRVGIGRLLHGTPAVLGLVAADAGISVTADAGIAAIAAKAHRLGTFAIDVAASLGLRCTTERPPASSGGHVSITHPDAAALQQALVERKVIVDKRDRDILRIGLSPLTTRFVDVHDGLSTLAALAH